MYFSLLCFINIVNCSSPKIHQLHVFKQSSTETQMRKPLRSRTMMLFEYYFWVYSARELYCWSLWLSVTIFYTLACSLKVVFVCRLRVEYSVFHFLSYTQNIRLADTTNSSKILIPAQLKSTARSEDWYWGHVRRRRWISFPAYSDWERGKSILRILR